MKDPQFPSTVVWVKMERVEAPGKNKGIVPFRAAVEGSSHQEGNAAHSGSPNLRGGLGTHLTSSLRLILIGALSGPNAGRQTQIMKEDRSNCFSSFTSATVGGECVKP